MIPKQEIERTPDFKAKQANITKLLKKKKRYRKKQKQTQVGMGSREWGSKGNKGDFNCKIIKLGFRANILSTTWKPDDKEKYFQVIQVITNLEFSVLPKISPWLTSLVFEVTSLCPFYT